MGVENTKLTVTNLQGLCGNGNWDKRDEIVTAQSCIAKTQESAAMTDFSLSHVQDSYQESNKFKTINSNKINKTVKQSNNNNNNKSSNNRLQKLVKEKLKNVLQENTP